MRGLLVFIEVCVVIGLAYWAYNENYSTQQALRRVEVLQGDIGDTLETLGVLRAEWAYLNRPDRLRELADLNFEKLQLMPLTPEHFGDAQQVAFPQISLKELSGPIDLSAEFPSTGEAQE